MSLNIYILFIQLPLLIRACGSDIGGTSSMSAEFDISFFAPIDYTVPADDDIYPGQSPSTDVANNRVKTDLNLAIGKALTANQIYLYFPPTLNITFTPQKVHIVDGDKCTTDNTYVVNDGTVIYKCVIAGTTVAPSGTGSTAVPSGSSVSTVEPSTAAETTPLTTLDPNGDSINSGETSFNRRPRRAAPRRRDATSNVKPRPFAQSMTVIATTTQPLFEQQWTKIARSVQQALEDKKLLFDDEIQVVLL
ncbi:unnamed protein product [Caenorhabditis brenneri]